MYLIHIYTFALDIYIEEMIETEQIFVATVEAKEGNSYPG